MARAMRQHRRPVQGEDEGRGHHGWALHARRRPPTGPGPLQQGLRQRPRGRELAGPDRGASSDPLEGGREERRRPRPLLLDEGGPARAGSDQLPERGVDAAAKADRAGLGQAVRPQHDRHGRAEPPARTGRDQAPAGVLEPGFCRIARDGQDHSGEAVRPNPGRPRPPQQGRW